MTYILAFFPFFCFILNYDKWLITNLNFFHESVYIASFFSNSVSRLPMIDFTENGHPISWKLVHLMILKYFAVKPSRNVSNTIKQVSNRSSHQRCSVWKAILEISQNSQENTCARVSFLIKLSASSLQLY